MSITIRKSAFFCAVLSLLLIFGTVFVFAEDNDGSGNAGIIKISSELMTKDGMKFVAPCANDLQLVDTVTYSNLQPIVVGFFI